MRGRRQRAHKSSSSSQAAGEAIHVARRPSAQRLDGSAQRVFETRFAHDFSGVRVHTDRRAAEASDAINARAYTFGRNIVFGADEYKPGTAAGNALLAHELSHVVEQSGGALRIQRQEKGKGKEEEKKEKPKDKPAWIAEELKKMLDTCDGGLGIWEKAKKANKGKAPKITPGAGGATDPATGNITLDKTKDKCFAVQQLIQELSNLSRMADFNKIFSDAAAGDLSRGDFIKNIERIEYETGVKNVLTAFDACKEKWPCTTTPKEWAREAKDFDEYFTTLLSEGHKEHYGTHWDKAYKAAYEKKHPTK